MCPDLSTKTFHLFSNTLSLVSYTVLIVIEKVKASTHVWCLPAELAVSPLISPESDLTTLPTRLIVRSVFMLYEAQWAVHMNVKIRWQNIFNTCRGSARIKLWCVKSSQISGHLYSCSEWAPEAVVSVSLLDIKGPQRGASHPSINLKPRNTAIGITPRKK